VQTSEPTIREAGVESADEVRLHPRVLVRYSSDHRRLNLELRDYLYRNLYYSPGVHEPNKRAARMLEDLFQYYQDHPGEIGDQSRLRMKRIGRQRAVCDYLAGMTDRYVMQEHQRLFGAKMWS